MGKPEASNSATMPEPRTALGITFSICILYFDSVLEWLASFVSSRSAKQGIGKRLPQDSVRSE
jgi:hypothetical protein